MAIKRITLSVPEEFADRLKERAGNQPVSAWVTDLIGRELDESELTEKFEDWYRAISPSSEDEEFANSLVERAR